MVTARNRPENAVFRAIADPTRRRILGLLRGGGRTVGEIAANFRSSRPAISKHLRLLRAAGLVTTRNHGAGLPRVLGGEPAKPEALCRGRSPKTRRGAVSRAAGEKGTPLNHAVRVAPFCACL